MKESSTEEGLSYQTEDEEGPIQMKQQEESTDMEIATMVEGRNKSNKEIGINKPMAFDGCWKKVETFIQECRLYLQVNKNIYTTDEVKVAIFLSFMTEKEALKWKHTFLRSITNDNGEMNFPTIKDFVGCLKVTSNPQTKPRMQLTNFLCWNKERRQQRKLSRSSDYSSHKLDIYLTPILIISI